MPIKPKRKKTNAHIELNACVWFSENLVKVIESVGAKLGFSSTNTESQGEEKQKKNQVECVLW